MLDVSIKGGCVSVQNYTNAAGYVKQAIPDMTAQFCQSAKKNLPAVISSGPGAPFAVVVFLAVKIPGDW